MADRPVTWHKPPSPVITGHEQSQSGSQTTNQVQETGQTRAGAVESASSSAIETPLFTSGTASSGAFRSPLNPSALLRTGDSAAAHQPFPPGSGDADASGRSDGASATGNQAGGSSGQGVGTGKTGGSRADVHGTGT